jgi:hypothetical protein
MSIKLNCFDCKHRFNLSTREPIMMICCGETACRECVNTKMIKNKQHAEIGVAKKGEFECKGCKCKYYSPFETDQAVPLKVNNIVKSVIA